MTGSTSRGAMTLAAGQAAGFLIGMAGSALLARLLGPEGRGTFELLVLFPNLAVLLFRGGTATAAVYHGGSDPAARLQLAARALGDTVLLGLLGSALGIGLALLLPGLPVPRPHLVFAFALFPFFLWISNARELLNGLGRFLANAVSIVGERTLLTVLVGAAFLLGRNALTPLFGLYLASIVSVALLLAFQLGLRPRFSSPPGSVSLLDYGLRSALSPILVFLHLRLDQVVLGWSGAAAELGLYVIAVTVSEVYLPLPDAIYSALYPRLMRAGGERSALAARASRMSHGLMLVIAIAVAVAARPVVAHLFGEAFLPALAFVPCLVAARLFQSGSNVLRASLLADGRPLQVSLISAAGLGTNAAALFLLVPEHGALGASVAALSSAGVEYLLTLTATSRGLGLSPFAIVLPRVSDWTGFKP